MIRRPAKSTLRASAAAALAFCLAAGSVSTQTRPRAPVQHKTTLAGHKKVLLWEVSLK
jgi:hypothetical protein